MTVELEKIREILEKVKERIEKQTDLCRIDTGVKFENYVVIMIEQICNEIFEQEGIKITVEQTGAQSFPDIIINNKYGVEVKYTKSDKWKSTGNSIFEGTFRKEVTDQIFMFFGKKVQNKIEVRVKNYEDSLSDIKVTHSPRFTIDMEIDKDATILNRVNYSYNDFRVLDSNDKAKVLKEFVKSNLEEGESVWWIDDTEEEGFSPIVKDFRTLQTYQKVSIQVEAIVFFPEIFSSQSTKYLNTSIYFLQQYQLISSSLRDAFSAGGKVDLVIKGSPVKIPQIYKLLYTHAREIKNVIEQTQDEKLQEYWLEHGVDAVKGRNKLEKWKALINSLANGLPNNISATDIFEEGLSK